VAARSKPFADRRCAIPFTESRPARLGFDQAGLGIFVARRRCQHHCPTGAAVFVPSLRLFPADFGLEPVRQHGQHGGEHGASSLPSRFRCFPVDFGLEPVRQHGQLREPSGHNADACSHPGCRCLNLVAFVSGISSRILRLEGDWFLQSSEHPGHCLFERVRRGGQRLQRLGFEPARRNQSFEWFVKWQRWQE
jgi:hypothetical protein